ncbi:hypothetical protein QBC34DRAFT_378378 [Podospora aff. communis PSN243]|uniref:Uncharacterized protein n=1 Tax=Podospora aff. communis PSN243 TaxID=3040156 RepID=A0AAV9GT36_9PEZI|nr:hypothetical protein QBC34DRAFT_378378 [Podospora aff. communis PSN243]
MGNPGYSDEVAEECHDLIDRAEEEAHDHAKANIPLPCQTGMHENDPTSSSKSKMKSSKSGLESKSSDMSRGMSSTVEGTKESMGNTMDSMKDSMGMKK